MANVLDKVKPALQGAAVRVLRETVRLPSLVSRGLESVAAQRGDRIQVPYSSALPLTDINASTGASEDPPDIDPGRVEVTMNNWREAQFRVNGKEVAEMLNGVIPSQFAEAIRTVVNGIETTVANVMHQALGGINANETSLTLANLAEANRLLNDEGSAPTGRVLVLSPSAYAGLIGNSDFNQAHTLGTGASARITGQVPIAVGFTPVQTSGLPRTSYTAGTRGTATTSAAASIGASRVSYDRGSGSTTPALKAGDVISFGTSFSWTGHTYMLTEAAASTSGTMHFVPTLQEAVADNTAIQVAPTRTVFGMAMHPDAVALVMRPTDPTIGEGNAFAVTDDVSGVSLLIREYGQAHATRWSVSALWGVQMTDPRRAVQLF